MGTVFILRERLPRRLIAGIGLAAIGGVMIGSGDGLALLGAVAHSGYLLMGQRVRAKTDVLSYIAVVYGTAAVLTLIVAALRGISFVGYPTMTYVWMILLALGPQLLGHSSYNWALRYVSAAAVAVVILGEPVGAAILAYVILGEGLTWWKVVGGAFVLSGIHLATRAEGPGNPVMSA